MIDYDELANRLIMIAVRALVSEEAHEICVNLLKEKLEEVADGT